MGSWVRVQRPARTSSAGGIRGHELAIDRQRKDIDILCRARDEPKRLERGPTDHDQLEVPVGSVERLVERSEGIIGYRVSRCISGGLPA